MNNIAVRIAQLSRMIAEETDPEVIADLEVELLDLQDELEDDDYDHTHGKPRKSQW